MRAYHALWVGFSPCPPDPAVELMEAPPVCRIVQHLPPYSSANQAIFPGNSQGGAQRAGEGVPASTHHCCVGLLAVHDRAAAALPLRQRRVQELNQHVLPCGSRPVSGDFRMLGPRDGGGGGVQFGSVGFGLTWLCSVIRATRSPPPFAVSMPPL